MLILHASLYIDQNVFAGLILNSKILYWTFITDVFIDTVNTLYKKAYHSMLPPEICEDSIPLNSISLLLFQLSKILIKYLTFLLLFTVVILSWILKMN